MLGAVLRGSRVVRNGLIMQVALFLGMASYFLVLAVYLQGGRGLSALGSGAMFSFLAVAYLVGTAQADMSSVQPAEAGSLSGTLSAVQQVGNTVGVALIGIVFFGAMDRGPRVALEHGLGYLVAVTALLGLLAMLPSRLRRR